MKPAFPLRSKRRNASRLAFINAADTLFNQQGFAATSMEQIADMANLHVQTLYRHFPAKQNLLATINTEEFVTAFNNRSSDTLHFWHDWVQLRAIAVTSTDKNFDYLGYLQETHADPKLAGVAAETANNYLAILTKGIAQDMNLDSQKDRLPVLIASMLYGGNSDAVRRWYKGEGKGNLAELCAEMANEVIALVAKLK